MAKYTMEISDLMKDPIFDYFDFEHPFYIDDAQVKKDFQKKYLQNYYFSEIGQETVYRHKWMLKSFLDLKMPYYKQMFNTIVKSKDIEFLLNKDLREETIREVDRELVDVNSTKQISNTKSNNGSNRKSDASTTTNTDSENRASNINDGVIDVGLTQGKLTGTDSTNGVQTSTATNTDTDTQTANADTTNETNSNNNQSDKLTESTVLISKGNIGVTSSASLLQEWREVIIDIDEIIINDCKKFFMQIY